MAMGVTMAMSLILVLILTLVLTLTLAIRHRWHVDMCIISSVARETSWLRLSFVFFILLLHGCQEIFAKTLCILDFAGVGPTI